MDTIVYVTSQQPLRLTKEEHQALNAALDAANNDEADESRQLGNWESDYSDGNVYIFGVFQHGWRELPAALRVLLGTLIAKNTLNYVEFGVAIVDWKPSAGYHGGTYFRIRADGSQWEPKLTW